MNKLLKNYNLSLWIVRIVYVALSVLTSYAYAELLLVSYGISGDALVLVTATLSSILTLVLFTWIVGLMVNINRIFFVPINEFKFLAIFCGCITLSIKGLCMLLILAVPYAGMWLTHMGSAIGITVGMGVFYLITNRLYTNDMTKPYYLRAILFAYVFFFILGV